MKKDGGPVPINCWSGAPVCRTPLFIPVPIHHYCVNILLPKQHCSSVLPDLSALLRLPDLAIQTSYRNLVPYSQVPFEPIETCSLSRWLLHGVDLNEHQRSMETWSRYFELWIIWELDLFPRWWWHRRWRRAAEGQCGNGGARSVGCRLFVCGSAKMRTTGSRGCCICMWRGLWRRRR